MGAGKHWHKNRPGGRIIIYHGIDQLGRTDINSRFISQEYFDQQVAYFKEHFHIVSLEEYYKGNFADDRLTVTLTFDDGYANNLHYALPVLEKHQVPAAFFITGIRDVGRDILWPDFLDLASRETDAPLEIGGLTFHKDRKGEYYSGGQSLKKTCKQQDYLFLWQMQRAFPPSIKFREDESLRDYWQQMTTDEIHTLAQSPLVTIGSHSYLHTCLGQIDSEMAREEMAASKAFLERVTGKEVNALAFPDGNYTRKVVEMAGELGFKYQLAVDFLHPEDKQDNRLRERFGINPYISWNNQLASLLKGRY